MRELSAKFEKARSLIGSTQQTLTELRRENQHLRTELALLQEQNKDYKTLVSGSVRSRRLSRRASVAISPVKLERAISAEIARKNPDEHGRLLEKICAIQELLSSEHQAFFGEVRATAIQHTIDKVVWTTPVLCVKFTVPGGKTLQLAQTFERADETAQIDFYMRLLK
jgi:hypothetical protein